MLGGDEIRQYLRGAWRLMNGQADGMRLLDVSADGFWNSFFAIVVAGPVLLASWVGLAGVLAGDTGTAGERISITLRLAFIDFGLWIVPIIALAIAARPAGIADRFVHLVVASNWGAVLLVWMMLPPVLLRLFAPGIADVVGLVQLVILVVTQVLSWRLTNAALNKGPAIATAVFAGLFVLWLVLQPLLALMVGLDELLI